MKTTEAARPLSLKIRKNGFEYAQHTRGQRSAVYAQHYSENLTFFEVFVIRTNNAGMIFGNWQPLREVFPGNKNFGTSAWAYDNLESAMVKFNELES